MQTVSTDPFKESSCTVQHLFCEYLPLASETLYAVTVEFVEVYIIKAALLE